MPGALGTSRAYAAAAARAEMLGDDAEAARLQAWSDGLLLWRAWPIVVQAVGRSDPKLGAALKGLAPSVGRAAKGLVVDLSGAGAGTKRMLAPSHRLDAVAAALREAAGWDVKVRVT